MEIPRSRIISEQDMGNAVRAVTRQAHNPAERHWRAARKITECLNKTKGLGLVFAKDGDQTLSVLVDPEVLRQ